MISSEERQPCSENASVQIPRFGHQQRDHCRSRSNPRNQYRFLFALKQTLLVTLVHSLRLYIFSAITEAVEIGKTYTYSCSATLTNPVTLDGSFPYKNFPARYERKRGYYVVRNDADRWKLLNQTVAILANKKTMYTAVYSLRIEAEDNGVTMHCIRDRRSDGLSHKISSYGIHITLSSDPVITGPRAVLVGSRVTWSCVVPNITFKNSQLDLVFMVVNESSQWENIVENVTALPGTIEGAHRVVTNGSMRISGLYASSAIACRATLGRPYTITDSDFMPVKMFYLGDPVLTGPGKVDVGDSRTWACSVANVSFHQKGDFVLNWHVNGHLQPNSMVNTKITSRENGSSFYTPLYSISSTFCQVLKSPLCLMCVVRNVVVKEQREAIMAVTINGEEAEKCNFTTVGYGRNVENGDMRTNKKNGTNGEMRTNKENGTNGGMTTNTENGTNGEVRTNKENGTNGGMTTNKENGIKGEMRTNKENGTNGEMTTNKENGTNGGMTTNKESGTNQNMKTNKENGTNGEMRTSSDGGDGGGGGGVTQKTEANTPPRQQWKYTSQQPSLPVAAQG